MDRRTTLAIALCFLVFVGWQELYLKPKTQAQRANAPVAQGVTNAANAAATKSAPMSAAVQAPAGATTVTAGASNAPATRAAVREASRLTLENDAVAIELSDTGRWIHQWNLKRFRATADPASPTVSLATVAGQNGELELAFDDPSFADVPSLQGTFNKLSDGRIEWRYEDARVRISRVFALSGDYSLSADLKLEFLGQAPKYAFVSLTQTGNEHDPEQADRQILYWTEKSLTRLHVKDATTISEVHTPVNYLGAQNRYFLFAALNGPGLAPKGLVQPIGPYAAKASLVYPISGNSLTIPLKFYLGPKELTALRATDPLLDHTVDFGWFTVIAYPLLRLMKWFYQYVGNYGIAIILLTILLKIVTFPLTYKSMKSMKQMAALQPQLVKLRERYKDDKEKLNREMMTFMRSNGYNPVAGCLPMLIQMPVFFALYRVLYSSIELLHAPFALWITDLSAHDRLYVTPVLLSITMYVQQKLTPNTATDPVQAKMLQFMPLIFGAFMLWLPSGLTLYMLVNAIASIAQQILLNKKFKASSALTPNAVLKAR